MTLIIAAMREGEGSEEVDIDKFDESTINTKLPLAARMATFIRETTFELETINSKLQYYNEQLQDIVTTDVLTGLENRFAFNQLLTQIENETRTDKDWKMQADLDMYREKQLYHKGR